jgi:hypothetical protein
MKELLSQIRHWTVDGRRDDVSRHRAGSPQGSEPWGDLSARMKDRATHPTSGTTAKGIAGSPPIRNCCIAADEQSPRRYRSAARSNIADTRFLQFRSMI